MGTSSERDTDLCSIKLTALLRQYANLRQLASGRRVLTNKKCVQDMKTAFFYAVAGCQGSRKLEGGEALNEEKKTGFTGQK